MLFLTGPTASGKSAVALALAKLTGGEIVCADAFQLYAGLQILTAQPSVEDFATVPHHLYGSVPLTEEMDAARYARMAEACIAEIHARGKLPIITGGSGLYIKALTHGLSALPPADPSLRAELDALTSEERIKQLLTLDPDAAATVNLRNPRYVQRALEIARLTGRPAAAQKESFASGPRPGIRGIFLHRDRAELYERINQRTLQMIHGGVLDEVRAIGPDKLSATARKTLGLRELQQVISGHLPLEEAVTSIQQSTRQYAKRQTTWFRRERWMESVDCTGCSATKVAARIHSGTPRHSGPMRAEFGCYPD
jgi:tRNA dimethylallyltransferase